MKKVPDCTLYIIRHGETEWNVERRLQGHADSPLTEKGIAQVTELAVKLSGVRFHAAYASDTSRALHTARIILKQKKAVSATSLLRERSFGSFEGKPYEIYNTHFASAYGIFTSLDDGAKHTFKFAPDIESDREMLVRFRRFVSEAATVHAGKRILVVSHGAIIRTFLIHIGFGTYATLAPGAVTNSGYVVVQSDGETHRIIETSGVTRQG